jgi:hypothetical protein
MTTSITSTSVTCAASFKPSATIIAAGLAGALCLCVPTIGQAQVPSDSASDRQTEGAFPDAAFNAAFAKYMPPRTIFSPYYSWDAHLALNVTVVRKGSGAVSLRSLFQTAGTENIGSKVGVGGTGYLFHVGYVRRHSDAFAMSTGLAHLSSHLTRDLDKKLAEENALGHPAPLVGDPSEYNVPFIEGSWKFPAYPLTPELDAAVEPINFRFNGSGARYVRPIYLHTGWALWRGNQKSLVAETQHEIGKRPFNVFSLSLQLYAGNQTEGRFQLFVTASPGHRLHVSPNVGGVRDGIALGARLNFRA